MRSITSGNGSASSRGHGSTGRLARSVRSAATLRGSHRSSTRCTSISGSGSMRSSSVHAAIASFDPPVGFVVLPRSGVTLPSEPSIDDEDRHRIASPMVGMYRQIAPAEKNLYAAAPHWCDGFRRRAVRPGERCVAPALGSGHAHGRLPRAAAPGVASARGRRGGVALRSRAQSVAPLSGDGRVHHRRHLRRRRGRANRDQPRPFRSQHGCRGDGRRLAVLRQRSRAAGLRTRDARRQRVARRLGLRPPTFIRRARPLRVGNGVRRRDARCRRSPAFRIGRERGAARRSRAAVDAART